MQTAIKKAKEIQKVTETYIRLLPETGHDEIKAIVRERKAMLLIHHCTINWYTAGGGGGGGGGGRWRELKRRRVKSRNIIV